MRHLWLLAAICLAGCSYPATQVSVGGGGPMLRVIGAPPSAVLIVDGVAAGPAQLFGEGGRALAVAHGTHHVEVRDGGGVFYGSDVYFGDDTTKTINLLPGVK